MTDSTGMGRSRTSDRGRPPARDGSGLRAWAARRRRDERGATLVEAAFVTPVFILMMFGIIEFSGYVMARTSANAAVKAGARSAVVWGDEPMADRQILKRMDREGSGLVAGNDIIEEIKIWHATGPGEAPPVPCNASTECSSNLLPNQIGGAFKLASLPTSVEAGTTLSNNNADCYFGATSHTETWCFTGDLKLDAGWPPTDRRVLEADPDNSACPSVTVATCASTDYVGIWMQVRHEYWTGFFGSSVTFEVQSISKIESQGYDRTAP